MFIKMFKVRNFKSFKEVHFHFNDDINIFTGVNNSGKTTALEALSLWVECFVKLIRKANRADTRLGLEAGDYRLGKQKQNYFNAIISAHVPHQDDLFFQMNSREDIGLEALLENEGQELKLGFVIKARGNQYEINFSESTFDYSVFNRYFRDLPQAVRAAFSRPISFLEVAEEFHTLPKIRAMQKAHRSLEVTRNRLYQLSKNAPAFNDFCTHIAYILNKGSKPVQLKFVGRESDHVMIKVMIALGTRDPLKEIALLGSGTLQITGILLGCYEQYSDLNLVLLDEPDSHIHRDIQGRLLEVLTTFTNNTQVFMTSHNEALIRHAHPSQLFHLEPLPEVTYRTIASQVLGQKHKGFQPTPVARILRTLGAQSGLDYISALEADRLFLVEGEDDAGHFDTLLPKSRIQYKDKHMFWAFRGVDEVFKRILYFKEMFSTIGNGNNLWRKASLIIDKDLFTDEQRLNLMSALSEQLDIPVFIWSAYTFESTLLMEPNRLARLLLRSLGSSDLEEIEAKIKGKISELIRTKRRQLDDTKYLEEVFNRLKNRRNQLKAFKNILPPEGRLQPEFKAYALDLMDQGHIYHLANKHDFKEVVDSVFELVGKSFQWSDFPKMLDLVDPASWVGEWSDAFTSSLPSLKK